ncbi:MAG TPA: hypothetical protein VF245_00535 [Solirubrobacterales bacterium]
MELAQIGPLTTVLEAAATAVAAGAVLGSVAAGIRGLWLHWPARKIERRALSGSYLGGAAGAAAAFFDAAFRYLITK